MPGGTFSRSYDKTPLHNGASDLATVSDFQLDKYEITVGRFRQFVSAYAQDMTPAGAGKNPNNPADSGWIKAADGLLPATPAALRAGLKCDKSYSSWTDAPGSNENRPLSCLSWYEAFAFCIWDGGRLPTEAEWNYAAAGGTDQRAYPWSLPDTAPTINCTYASYHNGSTCCGDGKGPCSLTDLVPVGLLSAGNGKWGHADLAGNVAEWVADWYSGDYDVPCVDCTNSFDAPARMVRGGSFIFDALFARTSDRFNEDPAIHRREIGARCARAVP